MAPVIWNHLLSAAQNTANFTSFKTVLKTPNFLLFNLLWLPYGIGQTIIFSCCDSFFILLLLSFFSSPNFSRRRLDVCHTSTHGVALVQI